MLLTGFALACRDMQDALKNVGFNLNDGILGAGILLNLKQKGGGHYFGTCLRNIRTPWAGDDGINAIIN